MSSRRPLATIARNSCSPAALSAVAGPCSFATASFVELPEGETLSVHAVASSPTHKYTATLFLLLVVMGFTNVVRNLLAAPRLPKSRHSSMHGALCSPRLTDIPAPWCESESWRPATRIPLHRDAYYSPRCGSCVPGTADHTRKKESGSCGFPPESAALPCAMPAAPPARSRPPERTRSPHPV